MVLRGMNVDISLDDLAKQCAVESVWTIDLCFLLRTYVQDFTYYTSYFGSRKEYQDDHFYQDGFDQDEIRVNRLFSIAKSSSIHVVRMYGLAYDNLTTMDHFLVCLALFFFYI